MLVDEGILGRITSCQVKYCGIPKCGHPEISNCVLDTSFGPNAIQTCIISPLKLGHLYNQDTRSQMCQHFEVPLYSGDMELTLFRNGDVNPMGC